MRSEAEIQGRVLYRGWVKKTIQMGREGPRGRGGKKAPLIFACADIISMAMEIIYLLEQS